MATLKGRPAMAARALEFLILTAARTGEVLGATWGEIDLEGAVWTVPAERMKAGSEHRVPLSAAALSVLEGARPEEPEAGSLVFFDQGRGLSNMAMAMLLRRMKAEITVHGFRSTFRDWAGDATEYPRELVEQALAHTIENRAERAYRRRTAVERRRALMEDWAAFLGAASKPRAPIADDFPKRRRRKSEHPDQQSIFAD
jgi:integrase